MGNQMHRGKAVCSMVLIVLFVLAGCANASVGPAPAMLSARVLAPVSSEEAQILEYLETAKGDFAVIDTLIEDKDLGLMEEDTGTGEEATAEDVSHYLGLLDTYRKNIEDKLTELKARVTPVNENIAFFKTAEVSQFELADDIVVEYMQVLNYIQSLLKMGEEMDQLSSVDTTDLEATYKAINQGITKAIEELKANEVPSFLKSMNDNMIASLNEMNDAVLYTLNAAAMNDPVRSDAAEYRMGILERKFTKISADADKDMEDRQAKLKNDLKNIQAVNKSLQKWVQDNIDKLKAK